jgi:4-hydroxyproline epimerase
MNRLAMNKTLQIIDSHTGGEPTRLVVDGGPELGTGSMAERKALLRDNHDWVRSASVNEPRGSDVLVGGIICEPVDPNCAAGIIFYNDVGYLNMCGHGTIGLIATLRHMGRIGPGSHRIETPVGEVTAVLHNNGSVTVRNVPSYRHEKDRTVDVPGYGPVTGDIAWGGNWFFLVYEHGQAIELSNVEALTNFSWAIRRALEANGVTGADNGHIDHVELFAPGTDNYDSKNYVMCPGGAYDRSPCGTGTSAKLACLYADGKLAAGQIYRQASVVGSTFEGSVEIVNGDIIPSITGSAWVNSEATLILNDDDPFCLGIC